MTAVRRLEMGASLAAIAPACEKAFRTGEVGNDNYLLECLGNMMPAPWTRFELSWRPPLVVRVALSHVRDLAVA